MCCVKENIFFKLNTASKETANYSAKEALVCKTHIVNFFIKSGGPKGVKKGGGLEGGSRFCLHPPSTCMMKQVLQQPPTRTLNFKHRMVILQKPIHLR